MKSNSERVSSIVSKAKKYKIERKATISTVTIVFCAIIAVTLQTSVNQNKKDLSLKSSGDKMQVSSLGAREENISSFSSKAELISALDELLKTNDIYLNKSEYRAVGKSSLVDQAINDSASKDFILEAQDTLSNSDFSKTNTQVQGVDEADIVKTDGKRIFYLNGDKLEIVDTTKKKLTISKEITFDESDKAYELYLDDDYFIVFARSNGYYDSTALDREESLSKRGFVTTKILIYDVNSYEAVREIEVEGYEIASRKVGDDIYLITNKQIYVGFDEEEVLPVCKDTCVSNDYRTLLATDIKYFKDFKEDVSCSYMIITSFSLDNLEGEAQINTYLGAGTEVYCSSDNLYVAKVKSSYTYTPVITDVIDDAIGVSGTSLNEVTTSIHKFALDDGGINYVATGKVKGSLLNQFSMDEYDGNFRITTTTNDEGNNLFVLDEEMNEIGKISNLASGERIYATRFMGDKAYVVTYKTVDPLFVIDLSNSNAPKVLGELKIPGYSSYLHPFGENYLIGFGEDSVEKSYLDWEGKMQVTAYANGLKMAIFDVSDYSNPKELYSIKIGNRGSDSELLYNHKALLFDENEKIFAFPAYLTSDGGYYEDGTPMYGHGIFEGVLVYDVSVENGITLRGKIEHEGKGKLGEIIERIIRIGDKLYTISTDAIKVSDIKEIKELDVLKF